VADCFIYERLAQKAVRQLITLSS